MKALKAIFYTIIILVAISFLGLVYIIYPNETGFVLLGVLLIIVVLGIYQAIYNKLS